MSNWVNETKKRKNEGKVFPGNCLCGLLKMYTISKLLTIRGNPDCDLYFFL